MTLHNKHTKVIIASDGQIKSISHKGVEHLHEGKNHWKKTEITCWPLFGSPGEDFRVRVDDVVFPMDQHGISRALRWENEFVGEQGIRQVQDYLANPLANPKYCPGKDHPQKISYLPARLSRTIIAQPTGVDVTYQVSNVNDRVLPYNLAWHPAFTTHGEEQGSFFDGAQRHLTTLTDLLKEPRYVSDTGIIRFVSETTGRGVELFNERGHFCLWSPHPAMYCIEPLVHRPTNKDYFRTSEHEELQPKEKREHTFSVRLV